MKPIFVLAPLTVALGALVSGLSTEANAGDRDRNHDHDDAKGSTSCSCPTVTQECKRTVAGCNANCVEPKEAVCSCANAVKCNGEPNKCECAYLKPPPANRNAVLEDVETAAEGGGSTSCSCPEVSTAAGTIAECRASCSEPKVASCTCNKLGKNECLCAVPSPPGFGYGGRKETVELADDGKKDDDGPKIGACEGTSYTVLSSHETVRPDSTRCGSHGESPTGVNARFKVELREYTECKDGKPVRTWRETAEEFIRCEEP